MKQNEKKDSLAKSSSHGTSSDGKKSLRPHSSKSSRKSEMKVATKKKSYFYYDQDQVSKNSEMERSMNSDLAYMGARNVNAVGSEIDQEELY